MNWLSAEVLIRSPHRNLFPVIFVLLYELEKLYLLISRPRKLLRLHITYIFLCFYKWGLAICGCLSRDLGNIWDHVCRDTWATSALRTQLFLLLNLRLDLSKTHIFLYQYLVISFLLWTAPHNRWWPRLLSSHADYTNDIRLITVGFLKHGPLLLQSFLGGGVNLVGLHLCIYF